MELTYIKEMENILEIVMTLLGNSYNSILEENTMDVSTCYSTIHLAEKNGLE